jgi:hypothetical protein
MFTEPKKEGGLSAQTVAIAAGAVLVFVAVLIFSGLRHGSAMAPNGLLPLAAEASSLTISNVAMSESTSLSGGKSTYLDGHIANHGSATVTGVTVQVLFANDQAMPPQVETVPVALVRMREPYIDTEPMSAAPLKPGGEADFRLIFEDIHDNWNQQIPEVRVVRVMSHP